MLMPQRTRGKRQAPLQTPSALAALLAVTARISVSGADSPSLQESAATQAGTESVGRISPPDESQVCQLVPNGDFTKDLNGWLGTPTAEFTPAAFASTGLTIVNGSDLLIPLDEDVARLFAAATADGTEIEPGGIAAATAEMVLSTSAIASGRYLRMSLVGAWEVIFFASGQYSVDVHVDALGPAGQTISSTSRNFLSGIKYKCGSGISILGVLGLDSSEIVLDLADEGTGIQPIQLGDVVEIRVVARCTAGVADPCDFAQAAAIVYVDAIRFCGQPANGPDLNADGAVGGIDLAILLAAWGRCAGVCPADLNSDSTVDGLDLAMLLAAWGEQ